jgi:hypothetical protein
LCRRWWRDVWNRTDGREFWCTGILKTCEYRHAHTHFYVTFTFNRQGVFVSCSFHCSLPDEWVSESEAQSRRTVPIPSLCPAAMTSLQTALFVPRRNKQRRKPPKCTWWPDSR